MNRETFLKITLNLQKQSKHLSILSSNGVDLINFTDTYYKIISTLIKEIYGEEGEDWFSWFCYDNNFGTGGLNAFDKDKNHICYSHETLWDFLEEIRKNK